MYYLVALVEPLSSEVIKILAHTRAYVVFYARARKAPKKTAWMPAMHRFAARRRRIEEGPSRPSGHDLARRCYLPTKPKGRPSKWGRFRADGESGQSDRADPKSLASALPSGGLRREDAPIWPRGPVQSLESILGHF